jgi:16S rRNA (uracil1498-N3)-methyltransferase
MARRRFFVPQVRRGVAELSGDDAEHLVRVLRAEVGQVYEISDNERVYLAEITVARKSLVTFEVREQLPLPSPRVHLILLAALIKFERFEWMIEKATELGVAEMRPVLATRTEHGLDRAASKRITRWQRIAIEASQQSRRVHLPLVHPPVPLPSALETPATFKCVLDEDTNAQPILNQLPETRTHTDTVALLLGPEGGWTEEERAQALRAGWIACSLGETVLRAETAAVAGLAIMQAAWEQKRTDAASPQREAS